MPTSPPFLKQGDTIAIISTARKVSPEEIQPSINVFESWGLKVALGENIFNQHNQFAGTDKQRLVDLQWAIHSKDIKAIICARGGYGTTRIIDNIDFSPLLSNPKWIAGFSDITAILCHLQQFNIESIHSVMPILFPHENSADSVESLRKVLFGDSIQYSIDPHPLNRLGHSNGILVGGNLSIIHNLIGTSSDVDMDGKILFLEDLDEYLYHIDRMMGHLKRAGKLNKLKGLVAGYFSDMKDNAIPYGQSAYEIIYDSVREYQYPICFGFPVGHQFNNMALICGRNVGLAVDNVRVSLSF